jgi:hypothetical protein
MGKTKKTKAKSARTNMSSTLQREMNKKRITKVVVTVLCILIILSFAFAMSISPVIK